MGGKVSIKNWAPITTVVTVIGPCLDKKKTSFRVSEKASFKPVYSTTQTG